MTHLRTILVALVALSLGALLGGVGSVQAQLGNGGNAIGSGGEAIAGKAGAAGDVAGARVGSDSDSRISTVGQCNTSKTSFRATTEFVSTTSQTYVNMPNSHRVINVGANGCIIVTVTADFLSQTNNWINVRAGIQGGPIAEPPLMQIGRPTQVDYYPRSMQFVFTNLPAGNHTVRLYYLSGNGTFVYVQHRMIKYEYR